MDAQFQTCNFINSFQLNASLSINGHPPQSVNILSFNSSFSKNILQGATPTGYAVILRPSLLTNDNDIAIVTATQESPRILAYNQTASSVNGLPAYSIATEIWNNGYSVAVGDLVIFEPATNPIWNVNRIIDGTEVSSSLYQSENTVRQLHRDLLRLKLKTDQISDLDLTSFLTSDSSIESGIELSFVSPYTINISEGVGRYRGQNFDFVGGTITSFNDKTLSRVNVNKDNTISLLNENSSGGSLDSDYNPNGTLPLPTNAPTPWTALGTASTEAVANGVFTVATNNNHRIYTRNGVAGSPIAGSTIDAIIQWVSGNHNLLEIDDGVYRNEVVVRENEIVLLNDLQSYKINTSIPIHLRITLKEGLSKIYVNGIKVIESEVIKNSIINRFRFGCYNSYSGVTPQNTTSSFKIIRLKTISAGAVVPTFPEQTGVLAGAIITINNNYTPAISLQTKTTDILLTHREEGKLINMSDLNKLITQVNQTVEGAVPVSTIMPILSLDIPNGYLPCEGALVSQIIYSKLFEKLQYRFVYLYTEKQHPLMTSDILPSPFVASASSTYGANNQAFKAFNGANASGPDAWLSLSGQSTGWLSLDYGAGSSKVLTHYSITSINNTIANHQPKTWNLEGSNDNSNWVILDSRTNITGWTQNQTRTFNIPLHNINPTGFRYFRINIIENNGYSYVGIGEMILYTLNKSLIENDFPLPDLRGEFLRGLDNGRGIDVDRELGSFQLDEFKSHTHYGAAPIWMRSDGVANWFSGASVGDTNATGGVETRPRNVAVNWIIKY